MARLRNEATGAVVSVSDEKVERMGSGWAPIEESKPAAKKAPAKKAAAKTEK